MLNKIKFIFGVPLKLDEEIGNVGATFISYVEKYMDNLLPLVEEKKKIEEMNNTSDNQERHVSEASRKLQELTSNIYLSNEQNLLPLDSLFFSIHWMNYLNLKKKTDITLEECYRRALSEPDICITKRRKNIHNEIVEAYNKIQDYDPNCLKFVEDTVDKYFELYLRESYDSGDKYPNEILDNFINSVNVALAGYFGYDDVNYLKKCREEGII